MACLSVPTVKISKISKFKMAAAAILKNEKSPYLGRVLTDFNQIWRGDALRPPRAVRPLKMQNFENPRWRRPPSWKIEQIAISRPCFDQFRPNLAGWLTSTLLSCPSVKNLKFSKYKVAADAILENRKSPYLGRSFSDFDEIWQIDAIRRS